MLSRSQLSASSNNLLVLQGREAILGQAPLLRELAERCGQAGAMHWLEYFLNPGATQRKPPYLVLQLDRPTDADRLNLGNVRAAALFFEYRVLGWRTRAFSTDDTVGFRTVIAPAEERAQMAGRAAQALIDLGAHVVLVTYEEPRQVRADSEPAPPFPGLLSGFRQRSVGRFLSIGPTFEDTLARLGKLTRRNLRYYRRRLEQRMACDFIADVRPYLRIEDLHAMNQGSINPVCSEGVGLRWSAACCLSGSFVSGLRAATGEWLSLIGGWRQGSTTVVHWQMNAAGHEQDSLSTVMRSFFLEHEVDRGTRRLLMYGGTPHPMRHSFEEETIADVLVCRRSARAKMLRMLARTVASPEGITGRSNFLARTLIELRLQPGELAPQTGRAATTTAAFGEPRGMRL